MYVTHAQTYAELSPQNPPPTQREGTPGAPPNGEPSLTLYMYKRFT